jgi:hypothetical protein
VAGYVGGCQGVETAYQHSEGYGYGVDLLEGCAGRLKLDGRCAGGARRLSGAAVAQNLGGKCRLT